MDDEACIYKALLMLKTPAIKIFGTTRPIISTKQKKHQIKKAK